MNKEFLDKLGFYEKAYDQEYERSKAIRTSLMKLKSDLQKYIEEKVQDWLGEDLDNQEKQAISEMGVSLKDIFEDIENRRTQIPQEIEEIRQSEFYQKYLEMTISHDFSLVFRLEEDETFNYFINQNFHNDKFWNKPVLKIPFLGEFQPRYRKFEKVAKDVAKRHRFEDYKMMFSTWATLRDAFREVLGNEKIQKAKEKFEKIQATIKAKNDEFNTLAHQEMDKVIDKISKFMFASQNLPLGNLKVNEIQHINVQKDKIQSANDNLKVLEITVNQILKNMSFVHELSLHAHRLAQNTKMRSKLEKILEVADPSQNLYEILTKKEYQKAMKAFEDYDRIHFSNAKVQHDQAEYNVTDLTPEQIQYLMKKYNVKEGEAFEPDPEDIRKLKLMG